MQIDAETAAILGVASSFLTSIIGYGIVKEKVRRLETDLHDMQRDQEKYVTFKHFDAVIQPLSKTLELVQRDVREILRAVSSAHQEKG